MAARRRTVTRAGRASVRRRRASRRRAARSPASSMNQKPMPKLNGPCRSDQEREHHDRGLEAEHEVDLVPASGRAAWSGRFTPPANATSATCAAITTPQTHGDGRDAEEAAAPRVRRPLPTLIAPTAVAGEPCRTSRNEPISITAPATRITMFGGRELRCSPVVPSADRAGVAFALQHHARRPRARCRPSTSSQWPMPLLADVGDEPADRHEAGEQPEHEVDLLPGEAEHLLRAASRRRTSSAAICERHDHAVEREQRREREEVRAPRARARRRTSKNEPTSMTAPAIRIVELRRASATVVPSIDVLRTARVTGESETRSGRRSGDFGAEHRRAVGAAIGCRACGSASWHRVVEPSSGPCSTGDLPVVVVVADRPCGGARRSPARPASRPSSSSAPISARRFDRVAYTQEVVDALERHDVDLVAIAGFGTILSKPFVDAFGGRAVNTHPALLPAFKGWHAVRDALAAGVKVTGLHRAPRHRRGRLGPDPRPGGGARPRRRHRGDAARTHQGGRAPPVSRRDRAARRERRAGSTTVNTKIERALLSVYDKTGLVDLARALHELGRRARVVGRDRDGDRRGRDPGHDGRRRHRLARDARRPGEDAAPEDPRRPARRSRQGVAPRRPRDARHPAVRARRVEPLPVPRPARHRDHRHRRPGDDARRGEEPRVGHDRHEPGSVRAAARGAARERRRGRATRRGARSRSRRSRAPPRTTPRSCSGCRRASSSPRTSCSRSIAPTRRCATARTRTSTRRATAGAARRAGGTACSSTAGSRSRTSTTTTPTRRGRSCTISATGRRAPSSSTRTRAVSCVDDDLAAAYQRALECDERSAFGGIVALNRPIDAATVERMVAGPQADVVIAPGYAPGTIEALQKRRKNTRILEAPAPERRDRSTSARSPAASSCRRRTTSRRRATTGGSSPRSRPRPSSGATSSSRGASAGT